MEIHDFEILNESKQFVNSQVRDLKIHQTLY